MTAPRQHGLHNSIIDVKGITVGNYTDLDILSGVTAIIPTERSIAAVDIRGAAPGTRETDLLNPVNLVQLIDSIILSGGSAYGLNAATGAMQYFEEQGRGHPTDENTVVPIVPQAILYDLKRGAKTGKITSENAYQACQNSVSKPFPQGNIGAATGALAGPLKGGLGTASETLLNGVTVGAIAGVNSAGHVADPSTGGIYAKHLALQDEFDYLRDLPIKPAPLLEYKKKVGQNTVIAAVATDAQLTKTEATRVAQMAHDGIARAVYPSHTMFDGDTVFTIATGQVRVEVENRWMLVNSLGIVAADVLSRAIVHGVLNAESVYDFKSHRDQFPDAYKGS